MTGKELKCAHCGAPIDGFGSKCKHCDYQTVKPLMSDSEWYSFQRAKDCINNLEFDKAKEYLVQIVEKNICVYFALFQCDYYIFYAVDYNRQCIPNIIKLDFEEKDIDFSTNTNCAKVEKELSVLSVDLEERMFYENELNTLKKLIEETYEGIKKSKYDVFICARISVVDDNGNIVKNGRQPEAIEILNGNEGLYYDLINAGIKKERIFWCEQGEKIDPEIYSALNTSKVFLIVASNKKNITEAVWVKSEWKRWKNILDHEKRTSCPRKRRTIAYYIDDINHKDQDIPAEYVELFKNQFIFSKNNKNLLIPAVKKAIEECTDNTERRIFDSQRGTYIDFLDNVRERIVAQDDKLEILIKENHKKLLSNFEKSKNMPEIISETSSAALKASFILNLLFDESDENIKSIFCNRVSKSGISPYDYSFFVDFLEEIKTYLRKDWKNGEKMLKDFTNDYENYLPDDELICSLKTLIGEVSGSFKVNLEILNTTKEEARNLLLSSKFADCIEKCKEYLVKLYGNMECHNSKQTAEVFTLMICSLAECSNEDELEYCKVGENGKPRKQACKGETTYDLTYLTNKLESDAAAVLEVYCDKRGIDEDEYDGDVTVSKLLSILAEVHEPTYNELAKLFERNSEKNDSATSFLTTAEAFVRDGDFAKAVESCYKYFEIINNEVAKGKKVKKREFETERLSTAFFCALTGSRNLADLSNYTYKAKRNDVKKLHNGLTAFICDFYDGVNGIEKNCIAGVRKLVANKLSFVNYFRHFNEYFVSVFNLPQQYKISKKKPLSFQRKQKAVE